MSFPIIKISQRLEIDYKNTAHNKWFGASWGVTPHDVSWEL